jgi:arylsulfatase A-like enzyme
LPQPASGLQGRSLRPLLRNPRAAWEERAISAWGTKDYQRPGLSVRTARLRYSENPDRTPFELFDYENDPWEWRNLAGNARYASERDRLRGILDANRA